MKLNHLNLIVTDVAATRAFFEKYFGLKTQWANEASAFLKDDNELLLALFERKAAAYPDGFHIGFMQESRERVNEIHQHLVDDGFKIKPPREFHGSWTFYFRGPEDFLIEVLC